MKRVDVALCGLVVTLAVLESSFSTHIEEPVLALACGVLMGLPILARSRAPLTAVLTSAAAGLVGVALLEDFVRYSVPFLTVLVMSYTAGSMPSWRRALVAMAAFEVLIVLVATRVDPFVPGDVLFPTGFALFAFGVGRIVQQRTRLAAELHEAALQAEEAREADAARAVAEERRRIAREMHDLVGHSVSVMVVQAGGARRILDRDPVRAEEAAARIEETGRAALAEMRQLLGLLGPAEAERAPQPTLDGLPGLVERSGGALRVQGEPRELPAGAEAAAFRVVQEALTNAIKHGGGRADVVVAWGPEALELRVESAGGPAADLGGSGLGLVGMQERTRAYGGALEAGPRPGGGFGVRATIPYDQQEVHA